MTQTVASTAVRAKQWDDGVFMEYVRESRFKRYMGSTENSIIQVQRDLTKKKGDGITFNLVGALDASSYNDGSTTLVGNEKQMPNDGHKITVGVVRDAVVVNNMDEQASAFDIRNAARTMIKTHAARLLKIATITALGSVQGVAFASATAAQKNAWTAANSDRVIFGTIANYNATFGTALDAITAGEKLTYELVGVIKRIAQGAKTANGDGIRPYRFGEDEETFVMFVGKNAFRDLRIDMEQKWENAQPRADTNPLFSGPTSILADGVVVREIPEIAAITNTGGVRIEPVYLCGAQALGVAWAKTLRTTLRKEDDYGYQNGVGFEEIRAVDKILWNQGQSTAKDWGMVTGFVAAAADA
jgi:hypothetical protein